MEKFTHAATFLTKAISLRKYFLRILSPFLRILNIFSVGPPGIPGLPLLLRAAHVGAQAGPGCGAPRRQVGPARFHGGTSAPDSGRLPLAAGGPQNVVKATTRSAPPESRRPDVENGGGCLAATLRFLRLLIPFAVLGAGSRLRRFHAARCRPGCATTTLMEASS